MRDLSFFYMKFRPQIKVKGLENLKYYFAIRENLCNLETNYAPIVEKKKEKNLKYPHN